MTIEDKWDKTPDEQTFSRSGLAITPSNDDMAEVSKGLFVIGAGTLIFVPSSNATSETITIEATVGMIIPYFVRQVRVGTTATVASLTG